MFSSHLSNGEDKLEGEARKDCARGSSLVARSSWAYSRGGRSPFRAVDLSIFGRGLLPVRPWQTIARGTPKVRRAANYRALRSGQPLGPFR